jgi:quercetin dioxygenase-like cupin family protein
MRRLPVLVALSVVLLASACAGGPPSLPYPAFIQADELPDVYIAGLPGVDAKQFVGDPRTRRSSNRLVLPPGWEFSTGASPGKSVEIYVLAGDIQLDDIPMGVGGYAYLPSGSLGMNMHTESGAMLMYFLDDLDSAAVIQTPLIASSDLLEWRGNTDDVSQFGLSFKELRADPGSGALTGLMKIEPGAVLPWQKDPVWEEGYLVSGNYTGSECVDGEVATFTYATGGYYKRPAGAVHGGPDAGSLSTSVWFVRRPAAGEPLKLEACPPLPGQAP